MMSHVLYKLLCVKLNHLKLAGFLNKKTRIYPQIFYCFHEDPTFHISTQPNNAFNSFIYRKYLSQIRPFRHSANLVKPNNILRHKP